MSPVEIAIWVSALKMKGCQNVDGNASVTLCQPLQSIKSQLVYFGLSVLPQAKITELEVSKLLTMPDCFIIINFSVINDFRRRCPDPTICLSSIHLTHLSVRILLPDFLNLTMVLVDALIIGGGPAGVSAALTLARQAQSSIVFDSGKYRNDATDYMHMVPAFDHSSPVEYRAAARSNIASRYDHVTFADIEIDTVTKAEDGTFRASSRGSPQSWQGKKVILASGVKDIFPNIEGYQDCWGKSL